MRARATALGSSSCSSHAAELMACDVRGVGARAALSSACSSHLGKAAARGQLLCARWSVSSHGNSCSTHVRRERACLGRREPSRVRETSVSAERAHRLARRAPPVGAPTVDGRDRRHARVWRVPARTRVAVAPHVSAGDWEGFRSCSSHGAGPPHRRGPRGLKRSKASRSARFGIRLRREGSEPRYLSSKNRPKCGIRRKRC